MLTEMTFVLAMLLPPIVIVAGAVALFGATLGSRASHQRSESVEGSVSSALHQPVGH